MYTPRVPHAEMGRRIVVIVDGMEGKGNGGKNASQSPPTRRPTPQWGPHTPFPNLLITRRVVHRVVIIIIIVTITIILIIINNISSSIICVICG